MLVCYPAAAQREAGHHSLHDGRIFKKKKGAVLLNRNTMASHRKHYFPLESNPVLFTQLIHQLGVSPSLAFEDVLSINDPDLVAFIPRPALALILVFPTSDVYEVAKAKEEEMRDEYAGLRESGSGGEGGDGEKGEEEEPVMWFRQTINNACGLYAILHAISNGEARKYIRKFYSSSSSSSSPPLLLSSSPPLLLSSSAAPPQPPPFRADSSPTILSSRFLAIINK